MTTKQMHTPGPWVATEMQSPEFGHRLQINNKDGYYVAEIDLRPASGPRADIDANASLIAAAPELLEALRHAETALIVTAGLTDESGTKIIKDGYGYELKQIRAAIAKAEGR